MVRTVSTLVLGALLIGCGLIFPAKTEDADKEKVKWAEHRQRAAQYYDGGDFIRAAAQYKKALNIKPNHIMTQLGYAYSLKNTKHVPNVMLAIQVFNDEISQQSNLDREVKRIYGSADCYRMLAVQFRRRADSRENKGLLKQAGEDRVFSAQYANDGIVGFERVLAIDHEMEARQITAPFRASASLAPLAHLGIGVCCIVLGDRKNQAPLDRALEEINVYAQTAANARTWWEKERKKMIETEPMADAQIPSAGEALGGVEDRRRYDERIKSTIRKEALVRQALVQTYMYLERYPDAIDQCTRVVELDDTAPDALYYRARAYALLKPPQYERAIEDMKEYRTRQDLSRLTQKVIQINKLIRSYERKLHEQKKQAEADRTTNG